ncbi:hypothetical protein CANTEDRAFT_114342, partial [Yamadazyma tenuis ATCC 10573]
MSYSDAVKSSGPVGAKKVPPVPTVNNTSSPNGNVEVIPEDKLKEFEPKKQQFDGSKIKDFSKEIKKAKDSQAVEDAEDFFKKLYGRLGEAFKTAGNTLHKVGLKASEKGQLAVATTSTELKNPVVVLQAVVGITGLIGGYFAYFERHRIDTSNKLTLALHGAIITGFVLVDGYLFQKFYPKY